MADTLTTIITSAAVAAIVSSATVIWNGWRERVSRVNLQQMQERHQTTLRELDRKHEADLRDRDRQQEVALRDLDRRHESRLQELADLRALRDLKVQRLRTNLTTLVDTALKLGDRELQLRMEPLRFAEPDPAFEQARARLADIRSALVLDTESERLLRDMSVMTRQYDSYLIALRYWQDLTEQAKAAMAAGMGAPPITGQREALEQLQKLGEQLVMFVNNVIDSARATLAELEQPIGDQGVDQAPRPALAEPPPADPAEADP